MRLPPEPILLATKRWLEILPSSGGIARAQALLTTHPQYSDLTPTQYATALAWARAVELLGNAEPAAPAAHRILSAIFEKSAPVWVQDADELVRSPDELPSDIVSVGVALGIDANTVYEQLVSSWGKVDVAERERVGAAGEAALVSLLRESNLAVEHVSTWSDGFGYDIAVSRAPVSAHLEVKSTTRLGRFVAYLSRHEYEVMLRDAHWTLVTVRLTAALEISGIGSVPTRWIAENVPRDTGPLGSWESCKLVVSDEVIESGIPRLGNDVAHELPAW